MAMIVVVAVIIISMLVAWEAVGVTAKAQNCQQG